MNGKKMADKWKSSLLAKLLCSTALVLLIPFIVSMVLTYAINYNAILSEAVGSNAALLSAGISRWKEYIDVMENAPLNFYNDADGRLLFHNAEQIGKDTEYKIKERLSGWLDVDASFRRVEIITQSGQMIQQEKLGQKIQVSPEWTKRGQEFVQCILPDGLVSFVAFRKDFIDYPYEDMLFTMVLYCDLSKLGQIASSIEGIRKEAENNAQDKAEDSVVGLFDDLTGNVIYSTGNMENIVYQDYGAGWIYGQLNGTEGFFFAGKCSYKGLETKFLKFIPRQVLLQGLHQTMLQLAGIWLVLLAMMLCFVLWVYRSMIAPIRGMAENMKRVEKGVYEYTSYAKGTDEIAVLDKTYAGMVRHMNVLINQEYKNALELSKSRLKMLQAQINPHFLNNMLQNISTKALKNGSRDIYMMVTRLARIFGYNMDTSSDTVAVSQELAHIENYLALQQERFQENLSYEIICGEDAKTAEVPKMILQPLVENSISHGLRGRETGGMVSVRIWMEAGKLYIAVSDNGIGMTDEKIAELRNRYRADYTINTTQGHGIGFLNVLYRLQIYTEGDFSWEVSSVPLKSTVITLCIGKKKGGQGDGNEDTDRG